MHATDVKRDTPTIQQVKFELNDDGTTTADSLANGEIVENTLLPPMQLRVISVDGPNEVDTQGGKRKGKNDKLYQITLKIK